MLNEACVQIENGMLYTTQKKERAAWRKQNKTKKKLRAE